MTFGEFGARVVVGTLGAAGFLAVFSPWISDAMNPERRADFVALMEHASNAPLNQPFTVDEGHFRATWVTFEADNCVRLRELPSAETAERVDGPRRYLIGGPLCNP